MRYLKACGCRGDAAARQILDCAVDFKVHPLMPQITGFLGSHEHLEGRGGGRKKERCSQPQMPGPFLSWNLRGLSCRSS